MNITLLTVGKTDKNWVKDGIDTYISRLKHYTSFSLVEIPELKNASSLTREQIKVKEGTLILKNLKDSDDVILLDERGKEYTSREWAGIIEKKAMNGRDIVFIIGGAYGFSDAVYQRASGMISMSRMTFSHQMIRAIFTEQLYRAFTIIKGEPYHHD